MQNADEIDFIQLEKKWWEKGFTLIYYLSGSSIAE